MKLRWGAVTDTGNVRPQNEDHILVEEPLFAVADGMGGHAAGEIASEVAIEALRAGFAADPTPEGLVRAFEQADAAVWKRGESDAETRGMGTTLTAAVLIDQDGQSVIELANVGDSRGYLLRDGELEQVTADHSLVEDLVRSGRLSREEAADHPQRHIVTRAIGIDDHSAGGLEVDTFTVVPFRGDRILLASDGLTDMVSDDQVASVLRRLADPDDAARELVRLAKAAGGNDNISVVLVDVVDDGDKSGAASAALADEPAPAHVEPAPAAVEPPTIVGAPAIDSEPRTRRTRGVGRPKRERKPPNVTVRTIGFIVAVLAILAVAIGAITWYAKGSYYVGLQGDSVTIFRGRPGGFLWVKPTVMATTDLTVDEVAPAHRGRLHEGQPEPTQRAARRYVQNLKDEAEQLSLTTTTLAATPPAPPTSSPPTSTP